MVEREGCPSPSLVTGLAYSETGLVQHGACSLRHALQSVHTENTVLVQLAWAQMYVCRKYQTLVLGTSPELEALSPASAAAGARSGGELVALHLESPDRQACLRFR